MTFTLQHDIDSMEGHAGYVRLDDDGKPIEQDFEPMRNDIGFTPVIRKRGRPRKVS